MMEPLALRIAESRRRGALLLSTRRGQRVATALLGLAGVMLVAAATFYVTSLRYFAPQLRAFSEYAPATPSRLYARPLELAVERPIDLRLVERYLRSGLGYRRLEFAAVGPPASEPSGWYAIDAKGKSKRTLAIGSRSHATPEGLRGARYLRVQISGTEVTAIAVSGKSVDSVELEPVELHAWLGERRIDRRTVRIPELPPVMVQAVLAAEDTDFLDHGGVSWSGILRAFWVNLRSGRIEQGGSTITQQLVKSLYLKPRRTFSRKVREAILASELDQRFSKETVLGAYLNEIYLGRRGGAEIVGVGAAARAYFGKNAEDLGLAEAATLAGMIASPGRLAPSVDPAACLSRRNHVLRRLGELGWVGREQVERALAEPIEVAPIASREVARHFVDAVAEEAAARYGVSELEQASLEIFSTLGYLDQVAAEKAIDESLGGLEKHWPSSATGLEAALVSISAASGEILAYAGGRDYQKSPYDRVRRAERQIGSLFKPFVYATSFEVLGVGPAAWIRDEPLQVRYDDEVWTPSNSGGTYGGVVTLRRAIELSLNSATVRLGTATGLDAVSARARDMGVPVDEETGPAFLLGASAATPLQMVQAYGMLANQGTTTTARGIRAIRGPQGPLRAAELGLPTRVLDSGVAYLVTSLLEGVVDHGTAGGVRRLGLRDRVAGKTGTSNDGRDSWFAGYTPDRATVVWVGFDDNRSSRWNGSRAALPLWARFVISTRPAAGLPAFERPEGLVEEWIDPSTGEIARPYCPARVRDFVPLGRQGIACHRHRESDAAVAYFASWGAATADRAAIGGSETAPAPGEQRMIFAVEARDARDVEPGQVDPVGLLARAPLSTLALGAADTRQSLLRLAQRDPAATTTPSLRLEVDDSSTVDLALGVPPDPADGIDVIELSGPMGWVVGYSRASSPAAGSSTGFD